MTDLDIRVLPVGAPRLDEWRADGERIHRAGTEVAWRIADWWRTGRDVFPDECEHVAEEIFGRKAATLDNYAITAAVFPARMRDHGVAFSIYQSLAPVARENPDDANRILERVKAGELNRDDVRALVRDQQALPSAPRPPLRDAAYQVWVQSRQDGDDSHSVPSGAILGLGRALGLA